MAPASRYFEKRDLVLNAIATHGTNGKPPSQRELAEAAGVSVATVNSYLRKMAQEGLIEWYPRSHRSVRIARPQARPRERDLPPAPF